MFNEDLLIEDHESTGVGAGGGASGVKKAAYGNFKTTDGTPRCLETLNDDLTSSDGLPN